MIPKILIRVSYKEEAWVQVELTNFRPFFG